MKKVAPWLGWVVAVLLVTVAAMQKPPEEITTRQLKIVDQDGVVRARLFTDGSVTGLGLMDEKGKTRLRIGFDAGDRDRTPSTYIHVCDSDGIKVGIDSNTEASGFSYLDKEGVSRGIFGAPIKPR